MKRIKEKFQVLGKKFSDLEVNKKRLLITGAIVAVAIPVLTIASLASMPTAVNDGGMFKCSDLPNLEANRKTNCDKYALAKVSNAAAQKEAETAKNAYEERERHCANLGGTDSCMAAVNTLKGRYEAAKTKATNAAAEEGRTEKLCNNSNSIINSLRGRCNPEYCDKVLKQITRPNNDAIRAEPQRYAPVTDPACKTSNGSSSNSGSGVVTTPTQNASSVSLYFLSATGTVESAQTINAGGEVANTVLSLFQGDNQAGQPVTAVFSLPEGVSLGAGHGILYNLNNAGWQELPNGANIVTTGVVSPSGIPGGQHIHFNVQLQGTAECGKTQTYPINAKIKLADGTELAAQPINLTVKGKACETPTQPTTPEQPTQPTTPEQPSTPDQANYIQVCDQNTNRIVTIKEADFDPKSQTKDLSKCPTTPGALPQTGPADTLIILVALTALTAGAGYYISGRKAKAPKA